MMPDPQLDQIVRRPLLLHPVSWGLWLVVGGALAYAQFISVQEHFSRANKYCYRGLPHDYADSDASHRAWKWPSSWKALAKDAVWWMVLTASPVALVESWSRRRFRCSLRGLCAVFLLVPIAFSRWRYTPHWSEDVFEHLGRCSILCWIAILMWLIRLSAMPSTRRPMNGAPVRMGSILLCYGAIAAPLFLVIDARHWMWLKLAVILLFLPGPAVVLVLNRVRPLWSGGFFRWHLLAWSGSTLMLLLVWICLWFGQ